MRAEDLVQSLSADLQPVPRGLVRRRIALGLAVGGAVTLAYIATQMGFRPDLPRAIHGFNFWMKWTYTISLATAAVAATLHLARPGLIRPRYLLALAIPFVLLTGVAAAELARTPRDQWLALWQGISWRVCSMRVLTLSAPIFAGLIWSFRKLAPTNLRLAGFVAGLASGACAATLYGLHCPEASAAFVLTWYTLGMLLAGLFGALVGPRLLRW